MPSAARQDDVTAHAGILLTGSPTVWINGRPAARQAEGHGCANHGTNVVVSGSASVRINGLGAARMGDVCTCTAAIVSGSENVMIGG